MEKPILKKWWFWVIIIVVIGAIGKGISKDSPKKVGETNATVETEGKKTEAKKEEKKNEPKIFKVGDVVELKDFKVTVNKVYAVKGKGYSKPKDGNEFVAVDCTVENISDKEKTISSVMMFKVVDKDGRACQYSITGQTAAKAGQMDGKVAPSRKLTGVYVVEVPKGTTGLELQFDGSFLSGEQIIVKLN
ncbi:DUF4352 domain-containing protein [Clostridium sp. MB40-C1]|uniref:DUF4352 domain-containing protein n=1 Tax=Clostridium sp. MB40-C1 TaxID=3070996 RepID=UPI0027E1CBCC|nr:DUF4352 domain-containing protein [Clostridium sp. MB40-C1]WMJ79603.1 DUF4352 domain-containing protein [Clostridium sp. MB40-C1]